jgi:hypothetical protein
VADFGVREGVGTKVDVITEVKESSGGKMCAGVSGRSRALRKGP